MDALLQDLRYAIRSLRKSRGFTTTAVLTLASGIAGTATLYAVLYAVALKPLPFAAPDRLVSVGVWEFFRCPGGEARHWPHVQHAR